MNTVFCSICFDDTLCTAKTVCDHDFCLSCLITNLNFSQSYPMCRHQFDKIFRLEVLIQSQLSDFHRRLSDGFHFLMAPIFVIISDVVENTQISVQCPLCYQPLKIHFQRRLPTHEPHLNIRSYERHLEKQHGAVKY